MAFAFSVRGTPPHAARAVPRRRVPTVPDLRGAQFSSIVLPTDGTNAARVTNENFGTFSFYGSSRASYGIPVLFDLWCRDLKHNSTLGHSGN
jgi:hypothetical protein